MLRAIRRRVADAGRCRLGLRLQSAFQRVHGRADGLRIARGIGGFQGLGRVQHQTVVAAQGGGGVVAFGGAAGGTVQVQDTVVVNGLQFAKSYTLANGGVRISPSLIRGSATTEDGTVEGAEQCDDSNTASGDGSTCGLTQPSMALAWPGR